MDGQGPAHTRGVGTSDTSKNWLKRCCTCAKTACSRNQCRCFAAHRCCNRNCYSGCNNKTIGQQKVGLAVIEATNKRMAKYNKTRDMRGCSCQATGCAGKSCGCAAGGGRCTSLCSCRDFLNGTSETRSTRCSKRRWPRAPLTAAAPYRFGTWYRK